MSIKGQVHSLSLNKGHPDSKMKTCFSSETVGSFENKDESLRKMGMKIDINELDHKTKMAAMPIYDKMTFFVAREDCFLVLFICENASMDNFPRHFLKSINAFNDANKLFDTLKNIGKSSFSFSYFFPYIHI